MGRTFKYYPSTAFLPSVALGALLTKIHLAAENAWERLGMPGNAWECLGTPENAWECLRTPVFFLGGSRSPVVLLSRWRATQSFPVFPSHSQSFSANRAPFSHS